MFKSATGFGLVAVFLALLAPGAGRAAGLVIPKAACPALPSWALSAQDFVPEGWRLEAKAQGDLNGDGAADIAFVLRQADPRNILDNRDGFGPERFDTNPHLLGVAFARRAGGYDLVLQNHTLITRPTEPNMEDVLEEGGIDIKRGALRVTLHVFANAGGWDMSTIIHSFRYADGRFVLIGYDAFDVQRNTGTTNEVSVNYLTRRAKVSAGNIETDKAADHWKLLPPGPSPTIDQIGDGVEFDPKVPGEDR